MGYEDDDDGWYTITSVTWTGNNLDFLPPPVSSPPPPAPEPPVRPLRAMRIREDE